MKRILFGVGAVALAALTSGCGSYYERSYAYAPPGATYSGDRYPAGYRYYNTYPSTAYAYPATAYSYPAPAPASTTGYYYSQGDYYRNYRGIHSADERNM
jgi:hypothetical protein